MPNINQILIYECIEKIVKYYKKQIKSNTLYKSYSYLVINYNSIYYEIEINKITVKILLINKNSKPTLLNSNIKNECCICYEETNQKTYCDHYIHEKCFNTWLKIKFSCPVCRTKNLYNTKIYKNIQNDFIKNKDLDLEISNFL